MVAAEPDVMGKMRHLKQQKPKVVTVLGSLAQNRLTPRNSHCHGEIFAAHPKDPEATRKC